ncbi:alpha-D-ribose 1-methylphosphonate 5-phosphate C-P-lyase PhnJ [Paenibacillus terrae]|nr:alpha-D-ribose 1-methylphosphonate 5-phosphate C-P-lyase PhnJ [Paenibacillus terrae]
MTSRRFSDQTYNFAFLDEGSKREIRRKTLKAIALPGHQVPFASRDLPIAKGYGTGGLQLTLAHLGRHDVLKVIDQGSDDSVNAVNIRRLVEHTAGIETTEDTALATLIQSRHRIPEEPLREDQLLILQTPKPEPLSRVEPREEVTRRQQASRDYSSMWLRLYEQIVRWGTITITMDYPVMVHDRYLMSPSPIPCQDTPKLHHAEHLTIFGAGREKKIYAVPPYTDVVPIQFEDYPFEADTERGYTCRWCGSSHTLMDEVIDEATGAKQHQCSDTNYCRKQRERGIAKGVLK